MESREKNSRQVVSGLEISKNKEKFQIFNEILKIFGDQPFIGICIEQEGVFKYVNNEWVNEFNSTTIYSVFGSAPNNVFAGGFQSTFYHYNGANWKALDFGDNLIETIRGIWCNEKYVFILQHLGYYSRILHGKQIN